MPGPLLFAYGTLRDAGMRDRVLRGAPSREVGRGWVAGALYDLGEYPGLITGDDRIPGVVIELADDASLTRLDEYEDVASGLYVRRRMTVRLDEGRYVEAWVYLYNRSVDGRRRIPRWQ